MEQEQTILVTVSGAVAHVCLNRPDKHNALNTLLIDALQSTFDRLGTAPEIRVIVLRGNGPSFCAGADLHYMREIAGYGKVENYQDALKLARLFDTIYHCPKPVVALLHGAVMGGANGLAAAADLVIAAQGARFAFSEVRLGITPATISPYVIRRCGEAVARELMLTGRPFDVSEALNYKLVNVVAADGKLEETLTTYLNHLLAGASGALAECKKLISDVTSHSGSTSELLSDTASRIAERRASEEGQEGIKAFFEKRKPNWFKQLKDEN